MADEESIKKRSKILVRDKEAVKAFILEQDALGISLHVIFKKAGLKFGYYDGAMSNFYDEIRPEIDKVRQQRKAYNRVLDKEQMISNNKRSNRRFGIGCLAVLMLVVLGPPIFNYFSIDHGAPKVEMTVKGEDYQTCEMKLRPSFESCVQDTPQNAWNSCKQIFMDAMADCTGKPREPL